MADEYTRDGSDSTSMATIVVAVLLVLIIGLAFYFGLIRGGDAVGGPEEGANVEFNEPGAVEGASIDLDADSSEDPGVPATGEDDMYIGK